MAVDIEKLLSDDAFIESVVQANDSQTVKKIFAEKGIVLSDEQIEDIRKKFVKSVEDLSREGLSKVAGGVLPSDKLEKQTISTAGQGGAIGLWVGAGIGSMTALAKSISRSAGRGRKFKIGEFVRRQLRYVLAGSLVGAGLGAGMGAASGALLGVGDVDMYAPRPERERQDNVGARGNHRGGAGAPNASNAPVYNAGGPRQL